MPGNEIDQLKKMYSAMTLAAQFFVEWRQVTHGHSVPVEDGIQHDVFFSEASLVTPERDQIKMMTSWISAKMPAWPATRRAMTKESPSFGTCPANNPRLTEYKPTPISGAI